MTESEPRPFASYTAADHARVAMAENAWSLLEHAYRATLPEAHRDGFPTGALIDAALSVQHRAEWLLRTAVVASHEQGMTWQQIGDHLGISRQSAHERFSPVVTEARRALATQLDALAADPDAEVEQIVPLVDTAWYAPRLDQWRAELGQLEIPGTMLVPGRPGELLAQLSDPDTAVTGVNGTTARGADAGPPRCRFTTEAGEYDESLPGDFLVCTLQEGHPGSHQLAVDNIHD